jgi:hypothetical protein
MRCPGSRALFLEIDDGLGDVQLALQDSISLEQLSVEALLRVQFRLAPHLPRLKPCGPLLAELSAP